MEIDGQNENEEQSIEIKNLMKKWKKQRSWIQIEDEKGNTNMKIKLATTKRKKKEEKDLLKKKKKNKKKE
ncbi:hypothetical protein KY284_007635 [Solanum tuberosum]|nr:hypothetical protein KY284_007635 [Solanum tuberosum]